MAPIRKDTAHAQSLLTVSDLSVRLPSGADRPYALQGFDLRIGRDEVVCLVGGSGSGKSIAARAIMRVLPEPHVWIESGSIDYLGEALTHTSSSRMRKIRGAEIGMIFQEPMTALNPLMRVGTQIDEAMRVHGIADRRERRARTLRILDEVQLPDPSEIYHSYPHQLSGGQRQRAMIAMALVLEPKLLIADEPTTALDVTTQAQILTLIDRLRRVHRTGVLFITHDFGVVAEIADRIVVMHHGRVVESGDRDSVLGSPESDYARLLLASVPGCVPAPVRAIPQDVVLSVSGVSKSYAPRGSLFRRASTRPAVQDVHLSVRRGETLGIVGESGSGKSTTARIAVRLLEPDCGSIVLNGIELTKLHQRELGRIRPHIQIVFQDPIGSLNPRHRVGEIVAAGPMLHGVNRAEARCRAEEAFDLVGLDQRALQRYPHEFSGGQRQRIALARALVMRPKVLVADEAVSALDVTVQAQILDLLRSIRDRLDLAILFVTHDLRVAAQICDSIAVMRGGVVVESGATGKIFDHPEHQYTRQLLASIPGRSWFARGAHHSTVEEKAREAQA
ncbi:MAG: ABC transporter ATP-binding protein [Hyphomicrobiaceae bacterium]|nr:MAG: ABC transporter ATP-binding protein [Hyphomicrobiaceae bacterium]